MNTRTQIEEKSLEFFRYPFRPASIYPSGRVTADRINAVVIRGSGEPEVWLSSGEILFIFLTDNEIENTEIKSSLRAFAQANSISVLTDAPDAWSWIADEFLDTQFDFFAREQTLDRLEGLGLSRRKVKSIRAQIAQRMERLTYRTWEWRRYTHANVLLAMTSGLGSILRPSRSRDFYWESMAIAAHNRRATEPAGEQLAERVRSRLLDHWRQLETLLGISGVRSDALFQTLIESWNQPHRHYHTPLHLMEVLNSMSLLATKPSPALLLAVWFHDVVYDPTKKDNEERSADLARHELSSLGIDSEIIKETQSLVLMTKRHFETSSENERLLADADLSILAAEPNRYCEYAAQIRSEFIMIDQWKFNIGRRRFLKSVLARPRIFFHLPEEMETRARENMEREARSLRFFANVFPSG